MSTWREGVGKRMRREGEEGKGSEARGEESKSLSFII